MEFWKLAVLMLSASLGGFAIFFAKSNNQEWLKLILSFSGAYLFAITVLHLIPEAYATGGSEIGIFVLIGFLFQIVLEQFSQGVEHGHMHTHSHPSSIFPLGIMVSLCLHAFLEGMPIAADQKDEFVFGIAIHHIPAAFALSSILKNHQISVRTIIICILVFASMSPLGYTLSWGLKSGDIGGIDQYFDKIMGVVIGIFLHISTTILFESSVNHKVKIRKMLAALSGIVLAILGSLLHG